MARTTPAVEAEATNAEVKFEFDGENYSVASDVLDDLALMDLFEQGKIITVVKQAVGVTQWATLNQKRRTVSGDLTAFTGAMFKALGTSTGE